MKKNWHDLTFFDAPKEDPYDWWQAVPEAHDLSGKAAARYFSNILRAPVAWMHAPLDVVDVPEAQLGPGQVPHEGPPPGQEPTYFGMLGQAGRYMGESGYLGAEGSAEDPWVGQDLTPEILEHLLPIATELAVYPAGGRALFEGGMQMVEATEYVMGKAIAGYERLAAPIAEAYRAARLPGRLAKSQERLASLGEEAMRGVEWWRDVNEAQKLAMLDDAERQITHTLDWVESSMAAEDDMRMALGIDASPQTPRAPGPGAGPAEGPPAGIDRLGVAGGPRVEGRVEPGFGAMPESTAETLERVSTHEPSVMPGVEETADAYAYMDDVTRMQLEVMNQRRRATINSAMNRAKMRATTAQRELLNDLEAAGVDFAEADQTLSVEPDKFNRIKKGFEDNMREGIPPKLVTEIHDRRIPAILRDPRYKVKTITPKHVEKEFDAFRTEMMKDKSVKEVTIVGSATRGGSEKDIDILVELHDKAGKGHIERIAKGDDISVEASTAYWNIQNKMEDIGFIDYEHEMGGLDIFVVHKGKTHYMDYGGHPSEAVKPYLEEYPFPARDTAWGERQRKAMAAGLNDGLPKGSPARITPDEILQAHKDPNMREKLAKLMARRIRNKPYYKNREQGFLEMSLAMRLGEMGIGAVTGGAVDEENRLRGAIIGALVAFTLGTVLRYGKGLGQRGAVGGRALDDILRDAGFFDEEIRLGVSSERATDALAGKVFSGSDLVPVTEEMIAVKQAGLDEMLEKLAFAERELPKYTEELIGTSEASRFLWGDTRIANKSEIIPRLQEEVRKSQGAVDRYKRQAKRASESILGNERGEWNIRQMQEKVVREGEVEGPEVLRKPKHTKGETKARGARRDLQMKMFGKAEGSKMGRDGLRAWVRDTYGKGLSEMTEAEMVVADQDLTRRIALSRIFPEGQLDNAVKIRNIEDYAMELHGAKAQKKIDAAVRKVVGQHRDLQQLNEFELTGVLEILPKRFLRTRGLGALIRQPLAVEDVMNRMGSWGKYITRQVRRERRHTEYLWSKWYTPLREEIRGLTAAEMDEVVAALHPMEANARQVIVPQDPKLQSIALRIRQDLNEIGTLRTEIGDPVRLASGGERPFEMMDNYYPLHIPPEEMTSSILIKRRIIEHLMETGQAAGPSEALEIHQRFIQETITNRFGNLDYAREAWIEPEKFDLLRDLSRYYYGAAKRISRHKYYGATRPGGELPQNMHDWLNGLRQDVGPDEFVFAQKAMKRHFKHDAVDDAMSDMLKRIRSFETVAHMGLAQIMNASEPVHTAVFAGFHNFAKGFARAIRGTSRMDARELVARNAAAVGSTIRDLFGEAGGAGSLTSKFLKYSGFSPIEKWNRKLASHVGIQYIESIVQKLARNPTSPRLRRMLDEVLINADDVLRNGLDEETLIKGAMELSNRTQKRTGVIDMPMFMSHPMGRIVAMFKTFAYGSARLMTRDFLFAFRRNPERLLRLLVAFPIVGEIVGDVRNLATGNIRDTEGLARLAENYMYVGTMGILYDFMRSVQFGEGSIQGFMTGPVGSDIAGIMAGTYQWLAEGKGRKLGKQALRMLPPPATLLRGEGTQRAVFGEELFPRPTKKWQIP